MGIKGFFNGNVPKNVPEKIEDLQIQKMIK